MAKLTEGKIVLNLNEGQNLRGLKYAYVGSTTDGRVIIITPVLANEAVIVEGKIEMPNEVQAIDEQIIIDVQGLDDIIGSSEYDVRSYDAEMRNGVIYPAYIQLMKVQEQQEMAEYQMAEDVNVPESLEELCEELDAMNIKELKVYAEKIGVNLIKKDWKQTIIRKCITRWKRLGVK